MKTRLLINIIVAIVLTILSGEYGGERAGIIETLEKESIDWRLFRDAAQTKKQKNIVIIDIDRDSLRELGPWPWPRNYFAQLNNKLFQKYQVRVVGYTLPFSEPDNRSIKLLDLIKNRIKDKSTTASSFIIDELQTLQPEFDYDRLFTQSLANRFIVLGYFFDDTGRVQAALPTPVTFINENNNPISRDIVKNATEKWSFMRGFSGNITEFLRSVNYNAGQTNLLIDDDGVVRRAPFFIKHSGSYYSSLPLVILQRYLNTQASKIRTKIDDNADNQSIIKNFSIGRYDVNLDSNGSAYIRFLGRGGRSVDFDATKDASFRYLSFYEVMAGKVKKEYLENKIVLIGSSSDSLGDVKATPVNPSMPGVEIAATQLANILEGNVLHRNPDASFHEILILLFLALILSVLFVYLGPFLSLIVLIAIITMHIFFVLNQWSAHNEVWSMIPLIVTLIGLFIFNAIFGFFFEWRSSKRLQSTFAQYVPADFAKRIGASGEKINLEGEEKELSVLFSDVRNFTAIAEKMSPREITLMMNRMLTTLSEAIHKHDGTVDKYIGDAVMAFWNAPLSDPEHAKKSILAAFDMQHSIQKLSDELSKDGGDGIRLGIGICTGNANVGNMGSALRMTYTAIGDTVNLASRTEGMTKNYSCSILVTEETKEQCGEDITFRIVDVVRVKGRVQPVVLYEPIGITRLVPSDTLQKLELFEKARLLYTKGQFNQASIVIKEYLKIETHDELAKTYAKRIEAYLISPPDDSWDGITNFKEK